MLNSGWIMQGPRVEEFENLLKEYTGAKYAVAVSSGTSALHLSMIVAGIKDGDEVICPSLSFIATANSIKFVNAKPVFCDVSKHGLNITPRNAENLITKRTKAILIVHQIGIPCDIKGFKELCNRKNLILIEDAACALGSEYYNNKIGHDSFLTCFSFHPRKIITTGEGGAILTNNKEIYLRLKRLRNHGFQEQQFLETGYNYRMTDIQAAIGIEQLKKIEKLIEERRKVAELYNMAFISDERFKLISTLPNSKTNYQSYCLYINSEVGINAKNLLSYLNNKGIYAKGGITEIHKQKSFKEYNKLELPNTSDMAKNSILLPIYYPMNKYEVKYIIKEILKFK
ncbi:MAG: DegT/DnrJ/EryC1/StrS family aminotransferase [Ignavibacteria bacterium]|nr:DegT/DnrJ/EryC1/StrS family aminotransferase [Ignavibacteria bacterium]